MWCKDHDDIQQSTMIHIDNSQIVVNKQQELPVYDKCSQHISVHNNNKHRLTNHDTQNHSWYTRMFDRFGKWYHRKSICINTTHTHECIDIVDTETVDGTIDETYRKSVTCIHIPYTRLFTLPMYISHINHKVNIYIYLEEYSDTTHIPDDQYYINWCQYLVHEKNIQNVYLGFFLPSIFVHTMQQCLPFTTIVAL